MKVQRLKEGTLLEGLVPGSGKGLLLLWELGAAAAGAPEQGLPWCSPL